MSTHLEKTRGLKASGGSSFWMPTTMPFQVTGAQRSPLMANGQFGNFGTRAAYAVGAGATGGNLVETALLADSFIEVLRNMTVTGQLGAQYLSGLIENINIPRQNAQTQTYWVGESSPLTEAEATFDQVQLRPHVVGALSKMSRLTLQQTTPAIEQLVRNDLLMVSALAIDAAALFGTGSTGQPTGIANTTNVGSVVGGTNGANWTFDEMVQLYAAPLVAERAAGEPRLRDQREDQGLSGDTEIHHRSIPVEPDAGHCGWHSERPRRATAMPCLTSCRTH